MTQLSTKLNICIIFKDSPKDCAEDYTAFLCHVLSTCTGTKSQGNQRAGIFVRPRRVNSWDIYKRIWLEFTPQNWHFGMLGILTSPNPIQIPLPASSSYWWQRSLTLAIFSCILFCLVSDGRFTGSWNSPAGRQSSLTPTNPSDSDGTHSKSRYRTGSCFCSDTIQTPCVEVQQKKRSRPKISQL